MLQICETLRQLRQRMNGALRVGLFSSSKNAVMHVDANLILTCKHSARPCSDAEIFANFEGMSEFQQLMIARAISGMRVE